ncbi:MAG: magnesium chelatase [Bacteroidota bacterium]
MNNTPPEIHTLAELKRSGCKSRSIRDELRENLVSALRKGDQPFPGIFGYEHTVLPELERAILSRHHINLLGLRGQAKTRLARMLVNLLDEWMPVVAGSEVNDDPMAPLSHHARSLLAELGGQTPITWVHRSERFVEKLATPDVTVADLIGDVDPIKAANLKLSYADERVIHFGLIPRAHRCIFVINELPDLQARIQVALFNILQEGDIQIRGFKLRFPLDIQFVFTANPEDYTNRGSIVTPLKDRIGSQILTHYPADVATAAHITAQEVRIRPEQADRIHIPHLAKQLIEQVAFEARNSEYVDVKSGISARMSITAYENLVSAAELRALKHNLDHTAVRLGDFAGIVPALTGKMEVAYEGEQEGARFVAAHLIQEAVRSTYDAIFPKIPKLEKQEQKAYYNGIIDWFVNHSGECDLTEDLDDKTYRTTLDRVPVLDALIDKHYPVQDPAERALLKEIILWGLVSYGKLSKVRVGDGIGFTDNLSEVLKGI